jgi:hypothetical protein
MTARSETEVVRRANEAFNARDVGTAAALMAEDVSWPDIANGGLVRGRDAVRDHWHEQFEHTDPRVDVVRLDQADGRVRATVRLIVREPGGAPISDERMTHVYTVRDGLIQRMEVAE